MTINEFFQLYPITAKGFGQLIGYSPKQMYNLLHRHTAIHEEEVEYFNIAIQELSWQLSKTYVHSDLSYSAKCRGCGKQFTAKDYGERSTFYNNNGLYCDKCMKTFSAIDEVVLE